MDGTAPGHPQGPYVLNLAPESWEEHLDRASTWLANVVTTQVAFRQALEIAVPKIEEPNIRQFLSEMLDRARQHEEVAHELPRALGREAADGARSLAGVVMDVARKALDTVEGLAGGARGNWKDLHHLLLLNLDAMGAFAIAEQLGLALAHPGLRDLAWGVQAEKSTDQLILQELMLEMAAVSILYGERV
ncbi:hypothetical protein [Rubellimicrobium arenae]|uniref:hypothetical protein n=1 Tax=Rubellimicrobium arenae TaxID=2817372 RepID=UPI001B309C40|nr:hypothetical protein [Rubellimicrobium arenae]